MPPTRSNSVPAVRQSSPSDTPTPSANACSDGRPRPRSSRRSTLSAIRSSSSRNFPADRPTCSAAATTRTRKSVCHRSVPTSDGARSTLAALRARATSSRCAWRGFYTGFSREPGITRSRCCASSCRFAVLSSQETTENRELRTDNFLQPPSTRQTHQAYHLRAAAAANLLAASIRGVNRMRKPVVVVLALLFVAATANAQYFGRNKVQWEHFEFKILKTEHFDIYYDDREADVVNDVGRQAERWYARYSRVFNHSFTRKPIVLYANPADFQQTTTTPELIGQGTGGFTDPFMNRVVLPLTGDYAENDHVLGHELVHVFQFDIAASMTNTRRRFTLGSPLIGSKRGIRGYLNLGPAYSPDGRYIAFLSTRDVFDIDLFLADGQTGKVVRRLASATRNAHFEALRFIDSAGAWSPDSKQLAFVVFEKGDNYLGIVDVDPRRLVDISVPGVDAINTIALSPEAKPIALCGQPSALRCLC